MTRRTIAEGWESPPRRVRILSGRFDAEGNCREYEITPEEADRRQSMYPAAANLPDPNRQEDA